MKGASEHRRLRYVLVTAARNEEEYIEGAIRSVAAQSVLPEKWVIVSDGSTDRTDKIVKAYRARYGWIDFVRMPERRKRHFAAKVECFYAGLSRLDGAPYDLIGNLDADITFEADQYQRLLGLFEADPRLGVAGTTMVEASYDPRKDSCMDDRHVHGANQLFRRECFEAIGGYLPLEGGGVDWAAVIAARMKGWRTKRLTDAVFYHHRPIGTAEGNSLVARFRYGRKDWRFGNHPAYELCRAMFQTTRRPYVVGGALLLLGYLREMLSFRRRDVPLDIVRYHRQEGMERLRNRLAALNPLGKARDRCRSWREGRRVSRIPARSGETRPDSDRMLQSVRSLLNWVEREGYKGYEPFDGLSSWLRPLTLGNWFAERVLVQVFLRCPWHIRPLLGVPKRESAQGMGYFARGYLRLWRTTSDPVYRNRAADCLDWLMRNPSKGHSGYCWGNLFDSSARPFQLPKFAPTVVWTSHIGQAFLDAYETLEDRKYLEVASSACDFILADLPREKTERGACISYVTFKQVSLHNSNMLAADLLARTARLTGRREALEAAREAMLYSCSRQRADGGWHYGESPAYRWIDNWHTAYNLDALKSYIEHSGDRSFQECLDRGYRFYVERFFQDSGRPNYYHDRAFVADIQSASQAIDTLANFADRDPRALDLALRVASWTIAHMQSRRGWFYYRILPWKTVKVPTMHWGQATMCCGLTRLLSNLVEPAG